VTTTGRGIAVTGPKLFYTADGKRCYGYSGLIFIDNSPVQSMLKFTTHNSYIVASFSFGTGDTDFSAAQSIGYYINFNGITVFKQFSASDADGTLFYDGSTIPQVILLPPVTDVELFGFTSDPNNVDCFAMLTGQVYDEPK